MLAESPPPVRAFVDFGHVPPEHADIDKRLHNWARWCIGGGGRGTHPMFASFRSSETWVASDTHVPVDPFDAQCLENAVNRLAHRQAAAVRWAYVYPSVSPRKVAVALACSLDLLREALDQARSVLQFVNGRA